MNKLMKPDEEEPSTTKRWWSIVPSQKLQKEMEFFMLMTGDTRQDIIVSAVEEYLKSHLLRAYERFQTRVKDIQSEADRLGLEKGL